jgi:hypothetical protein
VSVYNSMISRLTDNVIKKYIYIYFLVKSYN